MLGLSLSLCVWAAEPPPVSPDWKEELRKQLGVEAPEESMGPIEHIPEALPMRGWSALEYEMVVVQRRLRMALIARTAHDDPELPDLLFRLARLHQEEVDYRHEQVRRMWRDALLP